MFAGRMKSGGPGWASVCCGRSAWFCGVNWQLDIYAFAHIDCVAVILLAGSSRNCSVGGALGDPPERAFRRGHGGRNGGVVVATTSFTIWWSADAGGCIVHKADAGHC